MNTQHLKYVIEVERTCSITQAAENLYMGQPSLSKAIKELEKSLGYTIFERTTKGVTPTQKGVEFLSYARNILNQIKKMEALSDSASSNSQNFNISIPRGSYIADAITSFVSDLDNDKDINVNVQETNSLQVINNIIDGPFQLGIIRYPKEYENYFFDYLTEKQLRYQTVWEFEYLVLMSEKHPLARKEILDYKDFNDYIEISHGDTAIPYLTQGNNIKTTGLTNQSKCIFIYERCSQYDMLSLIPTTYMWVSPVPEKWLNRYNLIQRKCKTPGYGYKDLLIYHKDYKLSLLDKKFIDILSKTKNEVAFKDYK